LLWVFITVVVVLRWCGIKNVGFLSSYRLYFRRVLCSELHEFSLRSYVIVVVMGNKKYVIVFVNAFEDVFGCDELVEFYSGIELIICEFLSELIVSLVEIISGQEIT
jgi:hypothetical protein